MEMAQLMDWYRTEEGKMHPVTLATMLHYKFVRIHPFDDGNGRVARLLMNYVFLRNGFPPVVIKSVDKANYLRVLHLADVEDYEPLIDYVAEQVIWSQQIVIKGARGESIDEPGDFEKRMKFLKRRLNTDDNLEVKVTKSNKAIFTAAEVGLVPLFQRIHQKLSPLSPLFKSTNEQLIVNTLALTKTLTNALVAFKTFIANSKMAISRLEYHFILAELRESAALNVSVKIEVVFHKNVYEITAKGLPSTLTKLYDEPFDESEMEFIAESLGTFVLNTIETHIDEKS
jgi:hypothetical protein